MTHLTSHSDRLSKAFTAVNHSNFRVVGPNLIRGMSLYLQLHYVSTALCIYRLRLTCPLFRHIVFADCRKSRVTVELHFSGRWLIRIANYTDRHGPSGKYVENSTKLTCLEIAGYRINYSTVLWLLELEIRRGRNV